MTLWPAALGDRAISMSHHGHLVKQQQHGVWALNHIETRSQPEDLQQAARQAGARFPLMDGARPSPTPFLPAVMWYLGEGRGDG